MELNPIYSSPNHLPPFLITHSSFPSNPSTIPPPEPSPFPPSGWIADQFLSLAHSMQIINDHGVVIDPTFHPHIALEKEIKEAGNKLLPTPPTYTGQLSSQKNSALPSIDFEFIDLLYFLKESLSTTTNPEIIGGAVPWLLGTNFYLTYLQKRFNLSPQQASNYLAPFLDKITNTPNDIDCRQKGEPNANLSFDKREFKHQFSEIIHRFLQSHPQLPLTFTPQLIQDFYFDKLLLVDTARKVFGMARMGTFNNIPIEFILLHHTDRQCLFTKDQVSLSLHITTGYFDPNKKLITSSISINPLPSNPTIYPETTFLHQIGMLLDTPIFDGIDWRGWVAAMVSITKGFRTLNTAFFPNLWSKFSSDAIIQVPTFFKQITWGEDNHLSVGSDSEKKAFQFAFRWNVLIASTNTPNLAPLNIRLLIESIDSDLTSSIPLLKTLKGFLDIPTTSYATNLAWFRLALWLSLSQDLPHESLSLNFGSLAYRLDCAPYTQTKSVIWIELDLPRSFQLISDSLNTPEWEHHGPLILKQLFDFIGTTAKCGSWEDQWDCLRPFAKWLEIKDAKPLFSSLRKSSDPDLQLLGLKMELAFISLKTSPTMLSLDWLKQLPRLLIKYPAAIDSFDSLFSSPPSLETICSPKDWCRLLLTSQDHPRMNLALDLLKNLSNAEILWVLDGDFSFLSNHTATLAHLSEILKDRQLLHEIPWFESVLFYALAPLWEDSLIDHSNKNIHRLLPWILLPLLMKGSVKNFHINADALQGVSIVVLNKAYKVYFPPIPPNHIMSLFLDPDFNADCLTLFQHICPDYTFNTVRGSEPTRALLHFGLENSFFLDFASQLTITEYGTRSSFLAMKFILYHAFMLGRKFVVPQDWLENYLQIHLNDPRINPVVANCLAVEQAKTRSACELLILNPQPIKMEDWIHALLVNTRKEPQQAGLALCKTLHESKRLQLFQSTSPHLLNHNSKLILPLLQALNISLSPIEEHKEFLLKWLPQIISTKNTHLALEVLPFLQLSPSTKDNSPLTTLQDTLSRLDPPPPKKPQPTPTPPPKEKRTKTPKPSPNPQQKLSLVEQYVKNNDWSRLFVLLTDRDNNKVSSTQKNQILSALQSALVAASEENIKTIDATLAQIIRLAIKFQISDRPFWDFAYKLLISSSRKFDLTAQELSTLVENSKLSYGTRFFLDSDRDLIIKLWMYSTDASKPPSKGEIERFVAIVCPSPNLCPDQDEMLQLIYLRYDLFSVLNSKLLDDTGIATIKNYILQIHLFKKYGLHRANSVWHFFFSLFKPGKCTELLWSNGNTTLQDYLLAILDAYGPKPLKKMTKMFLNKFGQYEISVSGFNFVGHFVSALLDQDDRESVLIGLKFFNGLLNSLFYSRELGPINREVLNLSAAPRKLYIDSDRINRSLLKKIFLDIDRIISNSPSKILVLEATEFLTASHSIFIELVKTLGNPDHIIKDIFIEIPARTWLKVILATFKEIKGNNNNTYKCLSSSSLQTCRGLIDLFTSLFLLPKESLEGFDPLPFYREFFSLTTAMSNSTLSGVLNHSYNLTHNGVKYSVEAKVVPDILSRITSSNQRLRAAMFLEIPISMTFDSEDERLDAMGFVHVVFDSCLGHPLDDKDYLIERLINLIVFANVHLRDEEKFLPQLRELLNKATKTGLFTDQPALRIELAFLLQMPLPGKMITLDILSSVLARLNQPNGTLTANAILKIFSNMISNLFKAQQFDLANHAIHLLHNIPIPFTIPTINQGLYAFLATTIPHYSSLTDENKNFIKQTVDRFSDFVKDPDFKKYLLGLNDKFTEIFNLTKQHIFSPTWGAEKVELYISKVSAFTATLPPNAIEEKEKAYHEIFDSVFCSESTGNKSLVSDKILEDILSDTKQ